MKAKVTFTKFAPSPGGSPGQAWKEFFVGGKQAGILLKDPFHSSGRRVQIYTVIFNIENGKTFVVGDYPSARAAYEAAKAYARAGVEQ